MKQISRYTKYRRALRDMQNHVEELRSREAKYLSDEEFNSKLDRIIEKANEVKYLMTIEVDDQAEIDEKIRRFNEGSRK